jgi:type II secretory pathway component PulM
MIDFSKREKNIVMICAAVVLVAFIHWIFVAPALKKRSNLSREIAKSRKQLKEYRLLERQYDQILDETRKIRRGMAGRSDNFALSVSFIEQTAAKLAIEGNLTGMKPSRQNLDSNLVEDMVEVRLEGISLENLVAYLYEIEKTGAAIAVSNINIAPESRLGGGLNVSMLVTSIGTP